MSIDTLSSRGRRPERRDKAESFLGSYLAGGHRFAQDVVKAYYAYTDTKPVIAKDNVLKVPNTLLRAKERLGIKAARFGTQWGWYDPRIKTPAPPEAASAEKQTQYELAEIKRLLQPPQATPAKPEDTDTTPYVGGVLAGSKALDLGVDQHGFHERNPFKVSEPNPTVMQIHSRISKLMKGDMTEGQIVETIFSWAYPGSGLSEKVIAQLLKAHGVECPPRAQIRSLIAMDTTVTENPVTSHLPQNSDSSSPVDF